MNTLSNLRQKLSRSKGYREAFVASVAKRMTPLQIRTLRRQRDWSQSRLATESGLTQGVISRAEDPEYGNLTINTLVRIASGFDCAFVGRFIPFSELGRWYTTLEDERAMEVESFADDSGFAEPVRKECITPTYYLNAAVPLDHSCAALPEGSNSVSIASSPHYTYGTIKRKSPASTPVLYSPGLSTNRLLTTTIEGTAR